MVERNDNFRRDFESVDEYHKRLDAEAAERATFEPDIGKVLEEDPPLPFVVDIGPRTSRRDRDAIQAEQDRWDRWERMGR